MSATALDQAELVVRVIAQTAVDNETYFCELDAVVGDGDFGYSLARGFEVVLSDWDSMGHEDVTASQPRIGRAPLGETVTFGRLLEQAFHKISTARLRFEASRITRAAHS